MRRPAPTLPLTPRALKHMAAATVVLMVLLAMFADGATRDTVARPLAERAARNERIARSAQQHGAPKLALAQPPTPTAAFDPIIPAPAPGDAAPLPGPPAEQAAPLPPMGLPPAGLGNVPGTKITLGPAAGPAAAQGRPTTLSAERRRAIAAASRRRSGHQADD